MIGNTMPMPKQTLHTVCRWASPAADRTTKNISTTRGPPSYSSQWFGRIPDCDCVTYAYRKISHHDEDYHCVRYR